MPDNKDIAEELVSSLLEADAAPRQGEEDDAPPARKKPKLEKRHYIIQGLPDQLDEFEVLLDWVNRLCSQGHSASASLFVDGDGGARLKIRKVVGKGEELKLKHREVDKATSGDKELSVTIEDIAGGFVRMISEAEGEGSARLVFQIGSDWPDWRIKAWLDRDGWSARGVVLTHSETVPLEPSQQPEGSEAPEDGDTDTLITVEGPQGTILDLQRTVGGRTVIGSAV